MGARHLGSAAWSQRFCCGSGEGFLFAWGAMAAVPPALLRRRSIAAAVMEALSCGWGNGSRLKVLLLTAGGGAQ